MGKAFECDRCKVLFKGAIPRVNGVYKAPHLLQVGGVKEVEAAIRVGISPFDLCPDCLLAVVREAFGIG